MCALLIGIEQKKVNQVVDLSTAVQLVRLTRPQAIQCLVSVDNRLNRIVLVNCTCLFIFFPRHYA
jgi:hypothetical protein